MTLFKQIMMAIIAFGFVIFLAVGYLNFNSLNNYIDNQLGANAKHTADSLGLSLKSVVDLEDLSMSETMINSMFDSGYYQMIRLDDVDGKTLVQSSQSLSVDGIPQWFLKFIHLDAPIKSSEIMAGWAKFGTLYVQSSTGLAYYELYNGMKDVFYTLFSIFLVMILCAYFGLKTIFKPLVKVQKQAEAILDNKFIIQNKIPFTTDLKQMVLAMNSMVNKVKDIFESEAKMLNKYQELLYKDSISGLYNRRYFQTKFDEYITSEEYSSGAMLLISFSDILSLKKFLGFERWQSFIIKISQVLKDITENSHHSSLIARLNDNDFAILISDAKSDSLKEFADDINKKLHLVFDAFGINETQCLVNTAVVNYNHETDLKTILTRADVTLVSAKECGNFKSAFFSEDSQAIVLGKDKYRDLILTSMQNDMFKFAIQKVVSDDTKLSHSEIYLRLVDENGKWQMASYFMPMVNELSLSATLDSYVLQRVNRLILDGILTDVLAINLGKDIINSDDNFAKFINLIKKIGANYRHKIYIEIPNKDDISLANISKLIAVLKEYDFGFGLDHFEFNPNSIERLKEISPNYVKIRAANITDFFSEKDIDETKKTLEVIMGSKGIKIIGIGVENEEQKCKLLELGITSMQGIYIDDTKNIG